MVDNGRYDKGFIWNRSNCECKCDKLCDVGEYLDCENCKYRKMLIDKLVEECSKIMDQNKMIYYGTLNYHRKPYISCRVSIALFVIAFFNDHRY